MKYTNKIIENKVKKLATYLKKRRFSKSDLQLKEMLVDPTNYSFSQKISQFALPK